MLSSRVTVKLDIMLLGDKGIDKSAWLKRLLGNQIVALTDSLPEHSAWDFAKIKNVWIEDVVAEFVCFNTSAAKKFEGLVDGYIGKKLDAYLVFYNVCSKESFANVNGYVERVKKFRQNSDAIFLLMGIHFDKAPEVSETEAWVKANQLGMQSYYGINPQLEVDYKKLLQPLYYIIQHSPTARINVPILDFKYCIKEIDCALRFCWDQDRTDMLKAFKKMLIDFGCFGDNVTRAQLAEMQKECSDIVAKAQIILESAFPERVKMAVFAAATALLLTTAVVCGLALLNVITLPILTAVLIAGCVLGGAGGVFTLGCTIFKMRENLIYSSIGYAAEDAVKDFPGVRQGG